MSTDFYLDYRSPYSYLANTQVKKLGVEITYKPIDILAVMKMVNNRPSPECPPKARYALEDAKRWAKHYDVPYMPNYEYLKAVREGKIDGTLLSRVALAAQSLGSFELFHDELSKLVWASELDFAGLAGRQSFLNAIGPGHSQIWELAQSTMVKKKLGELNEEAASRGVFGVPTFFVGDEQFFGNDRLGFVQLAIESVKQEGT